MFEFLRIYNQWVVATQDSITLRENTPEHIVDIFNGVMRDYEEKRKHGIFMD